MPLQLVFTASLWQFFQVDRSLKGLLPDGFQVGLVSPDNDRMLCGSSKALLSGG